MNPGKTETKNESQSTVTKYFSRPISREEYCGLKEEAVMMCVLDLRPLSIVEGEGFRRFCNKLYANYKVSFDYSLCSIYLVYKNVYHYVIVNLNKAIVNLI